MTGNCDLAIGFSVTLNAKNGQKKAGYSQRVSSQLDSWLIN